ncbi:MAG TPA: tail tape measure protein [Sphingomonadaceae bacterium]|nr:tail tape measure protein [Sphingomonadaceae bacterium]
MDEEIDRLLVSVRADTSGFAKDVKAMRGDLEGTLGSGADRAGQRVETALARAVRTGKLGFEDLKRTALAAMSEIALGAVRGGIGAILGGGGGGGLLALGGQLLGLPGRATGGPVTPGRAYVVGERGPELFVPTASGRVESGGVASGRDVRVAITINAAAGSAPRALAQSGRQVARAVRAALDQAER